MIYAPFENRQKKLDLTKIDSPDVAIKSFDEIMTIGKTSKITSNPNAQINKDTIAVIMYTSVSKIGLSFMVGNFTGNNN